MTGSKLRQWEEVAGAVWEGRPLVMRELVTEKLRFWMVVHVEDPQDDGMSGDREGVCESWANGTSE